MFEAMEAGWGLDVILWFQDNRSGWMEALSEILDVLGADLGYVALFALIFLAINKREGIRLIFALVSIGIVTTILKDSMMRPRPFQAFPDIVTPVFESEGYGIPSGHSSSAVMIWLYIGLWIRKAWMWVLVLVVMVLMGTSRMIAGVHFPQDVLAGAIIGIVTLALYYPLTARWETFWNQQDFSTQINLAIAIPVLLSALVIALPMFNVPLDGGQIEDYVTMFGLALGVATGSIVEAKYIQFQAHEQIIRRVILYIVAMVILLAILLGLSPLFDLIAETGFIAYLLRLLRYGLVGFTGIAIIPWIGVRTGLLQSPRAEELSPATA